MTSTLKIGDILTRVKDTIDILDEELYTRITIKTKHAGVYKRDKLKGALIGTKKQFKVKKGQFILSKIDARLGAFGIVPEMLDDAIITGNFWVYEVDANKVNIDWFNLYTSSTSFYEVCNQASSGTTHRKYLDEKKFLNFSISLPTTKEQDSTYQWYINKLEKFSTLESEIKSQELYVSKLQQAVLQDAIQGKVMFQDPTDEPGSVLLERIKAEKQRLIDDGQLKKEKILPPIEEIEIPFELPKGWEWCRLGNITRINSGVTLGKTYKDEPIKVPYLRVANVQRGYIDVTEVKELNVPQLEIDKYQLRKGDLLMIEGGDWDKVGRCALWEHDIEPFIHQNHIYCIRSIGGVVNEYLEKYLNSPTARRYFESCSKQTTNLASINKTQLSNILVPLPPVQEQKRIVTKVNQLMRLCDEMEQQITQSKTEAEQLLQAVLREAFEGKQTVPKQASKQDEVFWQKQLLTAYINMLMEQHQEQGEMAIAKYTYLNDRVNNACSGFRYVPHNFGPYSPEIKDCLTAPDAPFCKKTVGKKGYEVYHVNKELEADFIDPKNGALQEAQKGFRQLMQVFSVFPMQERARQLELVASICWLIEQHQNTDLEVLYNGLESWPTPKRQVQHKGQLFSKNEAAAALQLIQQQGWHLNLLHQ